MYEHDNLSVYKKPFYRVYCLLLFSLSPLLRQLLIQTLIIKHRVWPVIVFRSRHDWDFKNSNIPLQIFGVVFLQFFIYFILFKFHFYSCLINTCILY